IFFYIWFIVFIFFFSSRRRHTRFSRDWSSDVCSSDLGASLAKPTLMFLVFFASSKVTAAAPTPSGLSPPPPPTPQADSTAGPPRATTPIAPVRRKKSRLVQPPLIVSLPRHNAVAGGLPHTRALST